MPMIMWSKYLVGWNVRVEVFALGHFQAVGRLEVVPRHDIVDVVDSSRSEAYFGEIGRPDAPVRVFCLVLREVGSVDVVVDVPASSQSYRSRSSHSW